MKTKILAVSLIAVLSVLGQYPVTDVVTGTSRAITGLFKTPDASGVTANIGTRS